VVGEVVMPSDKGRTATWDWHVGTVPGVEGTVLGQWHNFALEGEIEFVEVVSTGTFHQCVLHHVPILDRADGTGTCYGQSS
jgi:hypothetical protein